MIEGPTDTTTVGLETSAMPLWLPIIPFANISLSQKEGPQQPWLGIIQHSPSLAQLLFTSESLSFLVFSVQPAFVYPACPWSKCTYFLYVSWTPEQPLAVPHTREEMVCITNDRKFQYRKMVFFSLFWNIARNTNFCLRVRTCTQNGSWI